MPPDVVISSAGSSLIRLEPTTPAAKEWVRENLPLEGWQWLSNGFVIEGQYVNDIINGMRNDGLTVEFNN